MKKRILIIMGALVLIALAVILYLKLRTSGKGMASGTYYVTDCDAYPDAYLVVKNNTIQLFNIDLNAIYQEDQLNTIYKLQNSENITFSTGLSNEKLLEVSDLNRMFVQNAYEYDPDDAEKGGTYTYYYSCLCDGNRFGLHFLYDSWNKTITINNYQMVITFKK